MTKINRIFEQVQKRVVSFLLAMVFILTPIFTLLITAGIVLPIKTRAGDIKERPIIRDDALHFIFRYWHTSWDADANLQGDRHRDQYDKDIGRYFVIVEGYIIPHNDSDMEKVPEEWKDKNKYTIVLVDQSTGELVLASELYNDYADSDENNKENWPTNEKGEIVLADPTTPYLGEMNKTTGSIELKVKKIEDVYIDSNGNEIRESTEKFCGISLSAGRNASKLIDKSENGETDTILIDYSEEIPTHIVKGHVFFSSWTKTVSGTTDPNIIDVNNAEIDTADVYTWKSNGKFNGVSHEAGDVVEYNGAVLRKGDEGVLEKLGLTVAEDKDAPGDVLLTTFYSSTEGLHTNKTLIQTADGRIFLFDLEAWYIEGYAAQLGYIIDASGSMAGTSDLPDVLNIYVSLANRLGILFEEETGNYVYSHTDEEHGYHMHKYKTCSTPYYECINNRGEIVYKKEKDGKKLKTLEEINKDPNLELVSIYYAPTGEEKAIDMEKFLIIGDAEQDGWPGLVEHSGKEQICKTISETLGSEFTTDMFDLVASKVGAANNIGNIDGPSNYPKRESLIGYYEITGNNLGSSSKYPNYRTWFYNSIGSDGKYRNPTDIDYGKVTNDTAKVDFAKRVMYNDSSFGDVDTLYNSDNGWGSLGIYFSGEYGLNLWRSDAKAGFLLNAEPAKQPFTLSFELNLTSTTSLNSGDVVEILYVGSLTGNKDDAYFRMTWEGTDLKIYYKDNEGSKETATISGALKSTGLKQYTFVFTEGNVKVYQNGSQVQNIDVSTNLSADAIVLSPFEQTGSKKNSDSNKSLFAKNIFVYNTDLSASEVKKLFDVNGQNIDKKIEWSDVLLNDDILKLFLNPFNTSHVSLGVAAYNYFVINDNEFYPIAYWDANSTITFNGSTFAAIKASNGTKTALGELMNYNSTYSKAGWYFLSHSSNVTNLMSDEIGTDKRLFAEIGETVADSVPLDHHFNWTSASNPDTASSGKSYTTTKGQTIPFYIDSNGNLRCFYSDAITSNRTNCSYVYELDDSKYVKTEALQRILAYLSAEMSEKTPSSQISATQFSTSQRKTEDLTILDWSSNSDAIAGILSQKLGNGKAGDVNWSAAGVKEHNYALTGSTSTYTGLMAFLQNVVFTGVTIEYDESTQKATYKDSNTQKTLTAEELKNRKYRKDDENAPKFVIIFTDGADTDYYTNGVKNGKNPSLQFAETLKALDYTIIGIYLPAGTDPKNEDGSLSLENGTVYAQAKDFLSTLVSEDYVFASTDIAAVASIFDSKIMESINGIMSGYNVQEYIDSRFDLQTADGTVWHLNGNGTVTIDSVAIYEYDSKGNIKTDDDGNPIYVTIMLDFSNDKTFIYSANGNSYTLPYKLDETFGVIFHLTGENSNGAARNPYLRYDSVKDMYYLIWPNQTIQSSPIGSTTMMPVWSAEFFLVAKEDFIGGNDVLTSGNDEGMNYLYHYADISEAGFADYVFSSWTNIVASLRGEYVTKWKSVSNADLSQYYSNWMALTIKEQEELIKAWGDTLQDLLGAFDGRFVMFVIEKLNLKHSNEYDASSGTGDAKKSSSNSYTNDNRVTTANGEEVPTIDDFPSKGFPRIAVNVSTNPVLDNELESSIYLGELMSPVLILNNMVSNNFSNNYLDYLMRYAYYLYSDNPDITMPLIELIEKWNEIDDADDDGVKSFSVPYMYLPNVQYAADGTVMKVNKNKAVQLNSAGTHAHRGDVLGILTYHLKQVEPEQVLGNVDTAVVNEANMGVWEELKYELTFEFTILYEDDTYDKVLEDLIDLDIFDTTPIGNGEISFEEFKYDRTEYLNNLVKDDAYRPTVCTASTFENTESMNETTISDLARLLNVDVDELDTATRLDKFINNGRTQQVVFMYQPTVVGADLALELKIYKDQIVSWENKKITMTVIRNFTDIAYAEELKKNANNPLADYGNIFTIMYDFSETIFGEPDENGLYTIYAKASIEGTFGDSEETVSMTALPIGNYSFTKNSVTDKEYFELESAGAETDASKFKSDYFSKNVESLFDKTDGIQDNIAQITNDGGTNVISFGITNKVKDYNSCIGMIVLTTSPNNTALIVIEEMGGKSNENFLYRITGVANNGTEIDLVVSVKGGKRATILVPFGNYTVEEISDWSWRYENGVASEKQGAWTIRTDSRIASTQINTHETRIVTYTHKSNGKNWLGGENSENKYLTD